MTDKVTTNQKMCCPSCRICNGCGKVTNVWDGRKWRRVPATEAYKFEQRGRTVECPNRRFALEVLERPLIEIE
jgi:hypothetical protein